MSNPRFHIAVIVLVAFVAAGCLDDSRQDTNPLAPDPAATVSVYEPILLHAYDGDLLDETANHLDAVYVGVDPSFTNSCLDNALDFDGDDDWAYVAPDPLLEPDVVSLEVYFRPKRTLQNHAGFVPLVVKMPYWGNFWNTVDGYDMWYQDSTGDTGRIGFGIGDAGGTLRRHASWVGRITPNRYYHVVGTYDGSAIRLYLDGELVSTTPHSAPLAYLGGGLHIGGNIKHTYYGSGRQWFEGSIDEVALYPYVLTPEEISVRAARCADAAGAIEDEPGDDPDRRIEPGR